MKRIFLILLCALFSTPALAQLSEFGIRTGPKPLSAEQRQVARSMKAAKAGDVLLRTGNREITKLNDREVTEKVYSSPQWTAQGLPLLWDDNGTYRNEALWIRFTPDAVTAKQKKQVDTGNTVIKETYVVKDKAVSRLAWGVETNGSVLFNKGDLALVNPYTGRPALFSPPPIAWDSAHTPVPLTVTFEQGILAYSWNSAGLTYPVYVDPTMGIAGGRDGYLRGTGGDYATARDAPRALNGSGDRQSLGTSGRAGRGQAWR
jgi:hypothetical protein